MSRRLNDRCPARFGVGTLEDSGTNENAFGAKLHHERCIGRGCDTAGAEHYDRQPATLGNGADEFKRSCVLLCGGRELGFAEATEPLDLAVDRAQVADRFDDVAGAGFALGANHCRAFANPAQRLAEVGRTTDKRNFERPLVDVVGLVSRGQHFGFVDVIDFERFEHLRFGEVTDASLCHHWNRDRLLDRLDHLGVRHPRHSAVTADVGWDALKRHYGAGASCLGDASLFLVDHVHDHAALEHLCQAGLYFEGCFVAHHAQSTAQRLPKTAWQRICARLLEAEGLDAIRVALSVAAVDTVGERLNDAQQRDV